MGSEFETKFRKIAASAADFHDCEYRENGCRTTTVDRCVKKCRFFNVPISKQKEMIVKAYEALERKNNALKDDIEALKKAHSREINELRRLVPEDELKRYDKEREIYGK